MTVAEATSPAGRPPALRTSLELLWFFPFSALPVYFTSSNLAILLARMFAVTFMSQRKSVRFGNVE
jgi:hypothetical protein